MDFWQQAKGVGISKAEKILTLDTKVPSEAWLAYIREENLMSLLKTGRALGGNLNRQSLLVSSILHP